MRRKNFAGALRKFHIGERFLERQVTPHWQLGDVHRNPARIIVTEPDDGPKRV
jgi:hypothetical protein